MTNENEPNPRYEHRKADLLGGIYRVVKSIDSKVEELLDKFHDAVEDTHKDYFPDNYWDSNHMNGFY